MSLLLVILKFGACLYSLSRRLFSYFFSLYLCCMQDKLNQQPGWIFSGIGRYVVVVSRYYRHLFVRISIEILAGHKWHHLGWVCILTLRWLIRYQVYDRTLSALLRSLQKRPMICSHSWSSSCIALQNRVLASCLATSCDQWWRNLDRKYSKHSVVKYNRICALSWLKATVLVPFVLFMYVV